MKVTAAVRQAQIPVADPLAAHLLAQAIDQIVQLVLDHRLGLDLQQQVAAALQVQAEVDLLVGHPVRQAPSALLLSRFGAANAMPARSTRKISTFCQSGI